MSTEHSISWARTVSKNYQSSTAQIELAIKEDVSLAETFALCKALVDSQLNIPIRRAVTINKIGSRYFKLPTWDVAHFSIY